MKFNFNIKNAVFKAAHAEAAIECINIDVEYSIEEFTMLINKYPEIIDKLADLFNQINGCGHDQS